MNELNNAVLTPYGAYLPVYNIEQVDAKQKIWKGTVVPHKVKGIAQKMAEDKIIFFSRNKQPDKNELDVVYPELHFTNKTLIGVEFWLIATDKLLFGYQKASPIARPAPGTIQFNKRMN